MSVTGSARLATNRSRTPLALFRDLPVLGKLLALVGVVCALVLTVGVVGVAQLGNSQNRLKVMYRDSLEAILWLGDVSTDVQSMRFQVTNLALVGAPGADQTAHDVAALDKNIDANWTAYTATDMRGRESNRDVFAAALATYRQVRDNELIPLAKQNKVAEYIAVRKAKILPTATTMQTALANLTSIEQKDAQSSLAEAGAAYSAARTLILALIAVAVALAGILSAAIGRMISRPLHRTVTVLEAMAEGRLDQRVGITGRDEVGRMAGALDTAMDRLGGVLRDVDGNVAMLASSSEELSTVAAQMSGSAERSARQARSASEAAEQVNHNISTVASGAEELGASISEIARSASDAAGVAGQAVRISEDAGQILAKLGQSSNEIAAVVKLITTIAEQTNLLALNATIEAARAGDAGKGFAVVAGEVKELAQETAKATEDITARVSAIQADSAQAVSAISQINEVIQQINNTQSVIAAAVEEQSATTSEMSRGVGEVATGAQDISATLAEAAQIAVETTGAAGNTAQASTELARIATGLRQALSTMTY